MPTPTCPTSGRSWRRTLAPRRLRSTRTSERRETDRTDDTTGGTHGHRRSPRDGRRDLVAPGRGILAADESTGTIKKRFDAIGLESTEDNRRAYRDMLFTTPGLNEHVSGVILFDETIRQVGDTTARRSPRCSPALDIIPGIKVDTGAKPLALFAGETVTEGLDGLRERLADYRELGARFAKWRATILIGDGLPTDFAIDANGHAMARYAALCQEAGIVPIVEPEILMDGAHSIDECEVATSRTLATLYEQLAGHRVDLAGSLLKVNMVVSGADASHAGRTRRGG